MLAARVVYAGAKQQELFYSPPSDYDIRHRGAKKDELKLDGDKVFKFVGLSVPLILLWPISLPALGLFKLGQKYGSVRTSG